MKQIKIYKIIATTCLVIGFTGCTSTTSPARQDESIPSDQTDSARSEIPNGDFDSMIDQGQNNQADEITVAENVFETTQLFATEEQFISFIEQGKDYLVAIANSEMMQRSKDTLVHSTIKLGDFIFLGKPIGGWTIHDLSTESMEKVSQIMLELDRLLQEKVPEGYGKVKQLYQEGKGIMNQASSRFKEVWIDLIGEENYEYWGEQKDQAIDSGKRAWEWTKKKYKDITEKQR